MKGGKRIGLFVFPTTAQHLLFQQLPDLAAPSEFPGHGAGGGIQVKACKCPKLRTWRGGFKGNKAAEFKNEESGTERGLQRVPRDFPADADW